MNISKEEYDSKNSEKQIYLNELEKIIYLSNSKLEGNCFYHHNTLELCPELYAKQLNLFWCGKQATTSICEIGFNAGHSTMLMLLGRDKSSIKYTVFDVGHHKYTKPCLKYLQSTFSNVNFEYIEGDSTITMPSWINANKQLINTYDVVHVDGGHSEDCIFNDFKNADLLVKINGIVIIDDTNMAHINKYVDSYLSTGNYMELNVTKSIGYQHRIIKKIR